MGCRMLLTSQLVADAVMEFARDIANSLDMRDRRNAVTWLCQKIGEPAARQIASLYGLWSDYYFSQVSS